jgi:ribosomal protein S18 acetylase RimI-like enzyme
MAIEITRARIADLDRVHGLFLAYREFYGVPERSADARDFLAARLGAEDSLILLALDAGRGDDAALGFAHVYPTFSSLRMAPAWILNDLYVRADARGLGVGKALVEETLRLARARDVQIVSLQTARTNAAARALYESLGFHEETTFLQYEFNTGPSGGA